MELLTKLGEIQEKNGYLPMEEIKKLAKEMELSESEILGTASFYEYFYLEKKEQEDHIENLYPCRKEGGLIQYPSDDFIALKIALQNEEQIIPMIEEAGLKGRSGSAFPTATKWKLTAEVSAPEKYIVCNADEGEPGTGKDRVLLKKNPAAVIEGMLIAAHAVGAKKGYLYLREEYADLKEGILDVIAKKPENSAEVEVFMGHGAYVCGEETALLNSIEGKRGEPRLKPPFPGTCGLYGKPTVINNVETFACIPYIMRYGAEAFRKFGTEAFPGPKLFTIFGDVKNPGVYELSPGITLEACIAEAGGATNGVQGILTGGGSGTLLPESYLDMKMAPESCRERGASFGVASIRVFGKDRDLREEILKLNDFYIKESCGTCTPCREGLQRVKEILQETKTEGLSKSEEERLRGLLDYIQSNARCGFGQAAISPVLTLLNHFREVLG